MIAKLYIFFIFSKPINAETSINNEELTCSGGLLAQVLPKSEVNQDLIDLLEDKCKKISSFSKHLQDCNDDLVGLLDYLFSDLKPQILESSDYIQEIKFKCRCSRDRSLSALKLLGKSELISILKEDGNAEMKCEFCKSTYNIDEEDLKSLIYQ